MDVTAQRTTLDELRAYRNELEALVEQRTSELSVSQRKLHHSERLASIGTLTAGLAHQVNNPVGAILAASEYANRCRDNPAEIEILRQGMKDISEEARHCGEIVRNMLRFASDRETDKKTLPIDTILMSAMKSVRRIRTALDVDFDLLTKGPSPLVNASSIEIEQALMNLIENAVQSRDQDLDIRITRETAGEVVRVIVRDNGRGIPSSDLGRVLDPFFTSRLAAGGTGLGLSVAHEIAREHGGDLTVESELGFGTTAVLSLPTAPDANACLGRTRDQSPDSTTFDLA